MRGGCVADIQALIDCHCECGWPDVRLRQINPVNNQDGGEPGGNIRVGYLFNPARVSFVDRAGGTSTSSTTVVDGACGPQLSASPGRIQPTNAAFSASRKPLAGEFLFNGQKLFLDREPLQLEGRRPAIVRSLPAAAA